jgi:hypothetical protein
MLDFLEKLYNIVRTYKNSNNVISIFKEISDYHYRENYHSDILAFYLKYEDSKREFISWLNKCLKEKHKINIDEFHEINIDEYIDGDVEREEDRIDITLYNSSRKKAIIIENKSNNAGDQPKQIYRYYSSLTKKSIDVEAIFYLNKNSLNSPDLSDLTKDEVKEIENILVIGKLVEESSFIENVVKNVIKKTNDIRLNAMSQEIRDLFHTVIYGDINMENLENFVKELSNDDNISKLKKVISAYNDVPIYLVEKYRLFLEKKNTGYKISPYRLNTLVIDVKTKNNNYAFDIVFLVEKVKFQFHARPANKAELDKIKTKAGDDFPFKKLNEENGNRYEFVLENPLNNNEIENMLEKILKLIKKYII